MSEPLSLLRRERGLSRPVRRGMAFACAAVALAAPPVASAESLQPDAPSGSSSTGLQPDAFHAATAPEATPAAAQTQVTPLRGGAALPTLPASVTKAPLTPPPAAPKIRTVETQPRTVTRPVVTAPAAPAVAMRPRVVHRPAKREGARVAARHHAAPRLQLPTTVRGSFAVPASLRVPAEPVPTVARRRDLLPAALALLALVATSGCLLAVAARSRQEGLEV